MSQAKLSKETVEKVSQLARLKLSDAEMTAMSAQLSAVLENFEQIVKVDTTGVKPLVTPTDMAPSMREDRAEAVDSDKMLANAMDKSGRLFKVPPVV